MLQSTRACYNSTQMPKLIRPTPTNIEGFTDLDVRISPETGSELAKQIVDSVEWSQKFIQMTLPDRLIVTERQFVSLQPYTEAMYHTEDRMYVTPLNVMHVVIDRDVDTVEAVDQVLQDVEDHKTSTTVDNPTDLT